MPFMKSTGSVSRGPGGLLMFRRLLLNVELECVEEWEYFLLLLRRGEGVDFRYIVRSTAIFLQWK